MTIGKFVSYLRVSTQRQGHSGLGLEAQRAAVAAFLKERNAKLIGEFVEVETGKRDDRPQLAKALHNAKVTGATLVIAKLDRLSRNLRFIATLQEGGVRFVCADMPDATELTVHLFAAIAQHERKLISERTRNAMQAAKAKGRRFGNPHGARALRGVGNKAAVKAIKASADRHARDILPIIDDIRAIGVHTLQGIADELNARGIVTAREGRWYAATVRSVLNRCSASV